MAIAYLLKANPLLLSKPRVGNFHGNLRSIESIKFTRSSRFSSVKVESSVNSTSVSTSKNTTDFDEHFKAIPSSKGCGWGHETSRPYSPPPPQGDFFSSSSSNDDHSYSSSSWSGWGHETSMLYSSPPPYHYTSNVVMPYSPPPPPSSYHYESNAVMPNNEPPGQYMSHKSSANLGEEDSVEFYGSIITVLILVIFILCIYLVFPMLIAPPNAVNRSVKAPVPRRDAITRLVRVHVPRCDAITRRVKVPVPQRDAITRSGEAHTRIIKIQEIRINEDKAVEKKKKKKKKRKREEDGDSVDVLLVSALMFSYLL
ncbi:hypothetical protein LWI28_027499 [Acer negundo]|uniref:Transmembrane protein n=1 Tax=Acer negundo TaxID=4023 RepID=A0AAD5NWE4_ACENE|nr:hypothetical protein LWI28_027499 [Acer negundo]